MHKFLKASAFSVALLSGASAFAADPGASAIAGRWDAVLTRDGTEIPFRLDIKADGAAVQGIFYDGFRPYDGTTSAMFQNGQLILNVDHYLTTINAKFENGQLNGTVVAQNRESSADYGFHASRHVDAPPSTVAAPQIAGNWEIPLSSPSSKGENAFRFVVQQQGAEVAASILRIDGDTGSYTGSYKDGKWVLSHFDGGRPGVIVVSPNADGTLNIQQQGDRPRAATAKTATNEYASAPVPDGRSARLLVAYRPDVARAKGFATPDDFLTHTKVNDPDAVFKFAFPDNDGKIVTNEDPRFKGKVVLAVVTGTWCPNCHDEAQYLVELDRQYRDKGVAIVALNFEEPEQQETLKRQKAFVKQYGVKYTYLEAGSPAQMWEKVPQLAHLDTWPATVFIGRDGKVRAIHSGFASPASGEFHDQLHREFTSRIDELLAENPAKAADAAPPQAQAVALK
jgi:peroxiredoxin